MQKINVPSRAESQLDPFRSPLRYPGGKQRAISRIAPLLPVGMQHYREPMVGGGSVYFYARSANLFQTYWINDKFSELVAFWKTVQNRESCEILKQRLVKLRARLNSPEQLKTYFLKTRNQSPTDEIEAALLFFFFNRVTFSGTTHAGGFSLEASQLRFTASSIARLTPMPEALNNTVITNNDFKSVIEEPGENVFLFLDPPYHSANKLYGRNGVLHEFPHEELAKILEHTKHKFLITYDNCGPIRKLYKKWANLKKWSLRYGMNNCSTEGSCKNGSELFISNYDF